MKPNRIKEILFVGHLQEIDDLRKYGRNAPILLTGKNQKDLSKNVNAVLLKVKKTNKKVIVFITSPKIRAKKTTYLVGKEIKKILGNKIKICLSINNNLKATEQGELILPENYNPGEFFKGLKIASDIFTQESLGRVDNNLHYRFGDPVILPDGSYKYPELTKYFKAGGETYAESLIRVLNSVIQISHKIEELSSFAEIVIVSHGFNFHILRGLIMLSDKIINNKINIDAGGIAKKIWQIYNNNTIDFKSMVYVPLDITNWGNKKLIQFLLKEIEFLKNK